MNHFKNILSIFPLFILSGCNSSINRDVSPPDDTEWVKVEIKNPSSYTKPFPLEVRYISHECKKRRVSGFDGSVITEPSYNVIRVPMQQRNGDYWNGKVAMTGGSSCQWTLSAITLGIEYIDATHLGKDLVPGTAVGVTLAFDNDASRNGQFDILTGNQFGYSPKYYPFIKKWSDSSKNSMRDKLYLFGNEDDFRKIRLDFNFVENILINYQPLIDENKKVTMSFPRDKGRYSMYTFEYPDGSIVSSKNTKPDFNKLDRIKYY